MRASSRLAALIEPIIDDADNFIFLINKWHKTRDSYISTVFASSERPAISASLELSFGHGAENALNMRMFLLDDVSNDRAPLILVVGASGVGKDTLIDGARHRLAPSKRFVFPRREITRPSFPGSEQHVALDKLEFQRRQRRQHYCLSWRAHGNWYGIPRAVGAHRVQGRAVVVNVSRSVIADARSRLPPVGVVHVVVTKGDLLERLERRGREDQSAIDARLRRSGAFELDETEVLTVHNNRSIDHGVSAFVDALEFIHSAS